ncbi:uncharacterized protein EAE98_009229 [Botrytis deweyae]|uniref:Uncharacterized protein n=1 Tax=Botrytis deweyae TaxID=2478750 RepID=A0ABQ7ICV7_9HELO|nr:uncharacterized protein EAE98_009229 [Botrytis deweyae]KAF7919995.1 hypothetical protein EAE98_009229 [Botrytis deweyae]
MFRAAGMHEKTSLAFLASKAVSQSSTDGKPSFPNSGSPLGEFYTSDLATQVLEHPTFLPHSGTEKVF